MKLISKKKLKLANSKINFGLSKMPRFNSFGKRFLHNQKNQIDKKEKEKFHLMVQFDNVPFYSHFVEKIQIADMIEEICETSDVVNRRGRSLNDIEFARLKNFENRISEILKIKGLEKASLAVFDELNNLVICLEGDNIDQISSNFLDIYQKILIEENERSITQQRSFKERKRQDELKKKLALFEKEKKKIEERQKREENVPEAEIVNKQGKPKK